ncbi:MAG: DUF3467 domain-containing protein [Cytophagales bacterium]|nr:DUF3467 domain-containing protein [Cytophagales bacterium]
MSTKREKREPKKIDVELTEEMAEGVYANLVMITHSSTEFVVDFVRLMPGLPKAKVKSRVVVTPGHAKRLLKALADNIRRYENSFGEIKEDDSSPHLPMNLGGSVGEA